MVLQEFQKSTVYLNLRVTEASEKHANLGITRMGVYRLVKGPNCNAPRYFISNIYETP